MEDTIATAATAATTPATVHGDRRTPLSRVSEPTPWSTAIALAPTDRDQLAPRWPTVSVVIPTLNEAPNIGHVLDRLPPVVTEVVVVDAESTDETAAVVHQHRADARILSERARGKGRALAVGFRAATGEIIVTLDGDGSTDPSEIPRFVAALVTGADFAKGTRFITGGGSSDLTVVRRLGNRALARAVNALWRTNFSDLCYGYNAFWRACLDRLHIDSDGFEVETLLAVKALRSQLVVVEVPSFEGNRLHGVSNLDARRDGVRVLRTIIAERIRPA